MADRSTHKRVRTGSFLIVDSFLRGRFGEDRDSEGSPTVLLRLCNFKVFGNPDLSQLLWRLHSTTNPNRTACTTASLRLWTPSLPRRALTWNLTVWSLMPRRWAM